jgi:hypothetical protein
MTRPACYCPNDNDWLRYSMPYHFQKLRSDRFRYLYLPVNRANLPMGMVDGCVNYPDYFHQAISFDRDPHEFENIWFEPIGLYLYGDAPESKRDYGERLQRLLTKRMRLIDSIR